MGKEGIPDKGQNKYNWALLSCFKFQYLRYHGTYSQEASSDFLIHSSTQGGIYAIKWKERSTLVQSCSCSLRQRGYSTLTYLLSTGRVDVPIPHLVINLPFHFYFLRSPKNHSYCIIVSSWMSNWPLHLLPFSAFVAAVKAVMSQTCELLNLCWTWHKLSQCCTSCSSSASCAVPVLACEEIQFDSFSDGKQRHIHECNALQTVTFGFLPMVEIEDCY